MVCWPCSRSTRLRLRGSSVCNSLRTRSRAVRWALPVLWSPLVWTIFGVNESWQKDTKFLTTFCLSCLHCPSASAGHTSGWILDLRQQVEGQLRSAGNMVWQEAYWAQSGGWCKDLIPSQRESGLTCDLPLKLCPCLVEKDLMNLHYKEANFREGKTLPLILLSSILMCARIRWCFGVKRCLEILTPTFFYTSLTLQEYFIFL